MVTQEACFMICSSGVHGFHQGAQFPQHAHPQLPQASMIQPPSQTGSQFSGLASDTIQQQLGYSQRKSGVQHLPLQHATLWQQQPPSGQLTGEFQGIYMHTQGRNKVFPCTPLSLGCIVTCFGLIYRCFKY